MMYAYPIRIDRNRKLMPCEEYYDFPQDVMNMEDFVAIVGDKPFSFKAEDDGGSLYVVIRTYRPETDEEFKQRVASEEEYMETYNYLKSRRGK